MITTPRTLAGLELVGNALCLDFANTLNSRHRTEHDYLGSYAELLDWSDYAGSLDARATTRLRSHSDAPTAASVLAAAHRLRDTIFLVFSSVAHGRPPAGVDVGALSQAFAAAMRHAMIEARPDEPAITAGRSRRFALDWATPDTGDLDAPMWPIAHSAGELLLSGSLERVGECPSCGWLFLDISRNGTRRWCSMATCGTRDKMSRYHLRQLDRGHEVT